MSDTIRSELKACAVKIETTQGTDVIGGSPVTADYIAADWTISLPQDASENPEQNGAIDIAAMIAGGIRPAVTISVPLRGSGVAATAPEWGKLMRCCTYQEIATAVAIGVPTACVAAGSTTTAAQLAATPWGNTLQQYRGMPLRLTGDQTRDTLIQDYSTARLATLIEALGVAPTNATLAQIPVNFLYAPTSDETLWKTATIYLYQDGMRYRMTGCSGSWSLDMSAGKAGMLMFEMRGILVAAHEAVSFPTGWNAGVVRPTAPVWMAGRSQLGRALARTDSLKITSGVSLADPENPEAPQGFDLPVPVQRGTTIELAPFTTTTLSPTRFASFQAGTSIPYGAMMGAAAGNRIGVVVPSGRVTRFDVADRNRLGVDNISMMVDGADAGPTLTVW